MGRFLGMMLRARRQRLCLIEASRSRVHEWYTGFAVIDGNGAYGPSLTSTVSIVVALCLAAKSQPENAENERFR